MYIISAIIESGTVKNNISGVEAEYFIDENGKFNILWDDIYAV